MICLLAVVVAVLLVVLGGDGKLTIAGFALALVSGVAGAIPLFRGWSPHRQPVDQAIREFSM